MKHIILNCLLSIVIFALIFYSQAGVSGGDIAIGIFNVMFGLLQMLVAFLVLRKKKGQASNALLAIVVLQVLEMAVLVNFGYDINEWLKHLKYS
jgi:hypothetical protein